MTEVALPDTALTVDVEVMVAGAAFAPDRPAYPSLPHHLATALGRLARVLRPGRVDRLLRNFYRTGLAWRGFLVTLALLAYGGGAVLFYFHAIVLGEKGPAISPVEHWLLDSTLGFIGLSPAVFLIVPLAAHAAMGTSDGPDRVGRGPYALLGGAMFALATAPGPLLHNLIVGRGTWAADHVTTLLTGSTAPPPAEPDSIPPLVDMSLQVLVGLPTYILVMWLSIVFVRRLSRRRGVAVDTP